MLLACVQLFAPYLPFITEHVYQGYFRRALGDEAPASIHVSPWPIELAEGLEEQDLAEGRKALQLSISSAKRKPSGNYISGRPSRKR